MGEREKKNNKGTYSKANLFCFFPCEVIIKKSQTNELIEIKAGDVFFKEAIKHKG